MNNHIKLLVFALLVLFLDQLTKYLIISDFSVHEVRPVISGFFNLLLTFNKGVAFGFMSGLSETVRILALTGTGLLALAVLFWVYYTQRKNSAWIPYAVGIIVGGAVGNLIDRLRLGAVVDFLDFYIADYHWPAFNIADSAICVGVVILLFTTSDRGEEPKS